MEIPPCSHHVDRRNTKNAWKMGGLDKTELGAHVGNEFTQASFAFKTEERIPSLRAEESHNPPMVIAPDVINPDYEKHTLWVMPSAPFSIPRFKPIQNTHERAWGYSTHPNVQDVRQGKIFVPVIFDGWTADRAQKRKWNEFQRSARPYGLIEEFIVFEIG